MELREARWPTRFAEAAVERLSDGTIKWTSFDSYSSITLFANKYRLAFIITIFLLSTNLSSICTFYRHEVSIRFPIRVPDFSSTKSWELSRRPKATFAVSSQTASLYTYVSSCYSVLDVPTRWQPPVSLLLRWNSRLSSSSSGPEASGNASDAASGASGCTTFGLVCL